MVTDTELRSRQNYRTNSWPPRPREAYKAQSNQTVVSQKETFAKQVYHKLIYFCVIRPDSARAKRVTASL